MTDTVTSKTEAHSRAIAPLEKLPLETYVPPAKPSLIGLSRAEIADRLGEIGIAPAQRKMRTQQLWHWMYVRGAKDFDACGGQGRSNLVAGIGLFEIAGKHNRRSAAGGNDLGRQRRQAIRASRHQNQAMAV